MKLPTKAALVAAAGDIALVGGVLASFSYDLGPVSTILPPWLKTAVAVCGVVGGGAVKIAQRFIERAQGIKDSDNIAANASVIAVLSESMPQSPAPSAPPSRAPAGLLSKLGILAMLAGLCGCATTTTAGRVTNATLTAAGDLAAGAASNAIASVGTRMLNGEKVDTASLESAAAVGLFTQALSVQNASDVKAIFNAFSGDTMPATANKVAAVYAQANPQTTADKVAVVNAIATAVSEVSSK